MKNKNSTKKGYGILWKLHAILLLVFAGTSVLGQQNPCQQFPFLGQDQSQSLGVMYIEVPMFEQSDVIYVTGPTVIQRSDPIFDINGIPHIDTEILQMDLHGNSPLLGPVQVNLNPNMPSTGRITGSGPDMFYPAQSFFQRIC